jgi:predicted nucleic acid-binding protein
MIRVFVDSSVFFSAAYSSRGHARDIIMLALSGEIETVISQIVIEETRRNLEVSAPESLPFMEFILASTPFTIVRPTREDVLSAAELTALKDAPIAASAKRAKVDLLVTLDKKHLLYRPELAEYVGASIVTPKDAMKRIKEIRGE